MSCWIIQGSYSIQQGLFAKCLCESVIYPLNISSILRDLFDNSLQSPRKWRPQEWTRGVLRQRWRKPATSMELRRNKGKGLSSTIFSTSMSISVSSAKRRTTLIALKPRGMNSILEVSSSFFNFNFYGVLLGFLCKNGSSDQVLGFSNLLRAG